MKDRWVLAFLVLLFALYGVLMWAIAVTWTHS